MNARTAGWISYDWFKLIVQAILIALLLWLTLGRTSAPAVAPVPTAAVAPTAAAAPTVAPAPTTAPAPTAAPIALSAPTLNVPAGPLAPGVVTLSGTATPNSTVQIMIDGQPAGTAKAGADGAWSFDATLDTPGEHAVIAQALDAQGAVAAAASPVALTVAAPKPAIAAPTINQPTGAIPSGPFSLSGAGTPGSTVEVFVDGQSVGTVPVAADGSWSLEINVPDGEHEVSARALDAAGAEVAAASPIKLTFGGGAVAAGPDPVISSPADGAQLDPGPFVMSGTGAPGSTIEILDSDKVIGTAQVGADGTWSFPVTPTGSTAAYSARPAGSTDVATRPIRVSIGAPQAQACTTLAANCDAWVTRKGGLSLRLRAGAGTDQSIIARLPVGTQLKLLEGPSDASGRSWWRVRTAAGREGWVAGSELVLQPD